MKKALRSVLLVTALSILIPAAGRPASAVMQCSSCSCSTQCGIPCLKSDGTPSACGIGGNRCRISPICITP